MSRMVADVFVVTEQSFGDEATHLIDAVAVLILVSIDIVLLVVFANLVLGIGHVAADGHPDVANLLFVAEVAVNTL